MHQVTTVDGVPVSEVRVEQIERQIRLLRTDVNGLGGGGGVSDHGDLTGLARDDHTQYALADGSRGSFEAAGAAAAAIAAHTGASDPHPTYTTAAELAAAVSAHEALANPHPDYVTSAELTAALAGAGGGVPLSQIKRIAWWS
jgi:hypothetical protein